MTNNNVLEGSKALITNMALQALEVMHMRHKNYVVGKIKHFMLSKILPSIQGCYNKQEYLNYFCDWFAEEIYLVMRTHSKGQCLTLKEFDTIVSDALMNHHMIGIQQPKLTELEGQLGCMVVDM